MTHKPSAAQAQQTRLLDVDRWPAQNFHAPQPSLHPAGSVFFENAAAFRQRDWTRKDTPIYGTHGSPTTFELEARIAALEGGKHCQLLPSGLSAIVTVYHALLQPGDELIVPLNVYGANRDFITHELCPLGVAVQVYDPTQPDSLVFSETSRLLWIEAPGATTFEFPDIAALASRARDHGVLVALDSTWSAGVAFTPFSLPIDLSVQSLSKFACGSGDTLMGSITCIDKQLFDTVRVGAARHGAFVSPFAAVAVAKGLDTLTLRYQAQDRATRYLLDALAVDPRIGRLFHPALPGNPGHANWKASCTGAAALFSIEFPASVTAVEVDAFLDALCLFRIGFGWGGPRSLALPCGAETVSTVATQGEVVRVAVGLEDPADLLVDLRHALDVTFSPSCSTN